MHRRQVLYSVLQQCTASTHQSYGGIARWRRAIGPKITLRGAKRTSTVVVKDLPQGALPPVIEDPIPESDGPAYPTVVQQAKDNMRKFAHCVVLTRVGNFYELYFEHAEQYAPLLNLKSGKKKTNAGIVPMAGFPYYQIDRFLKMLVQDLGKHVAISEEFANDAGDKVRSGGLLFDRRVTRVISPGTLIDEKFVDPWESNYLLCVHVEGSNQPSSDIGVQEALPEQGMGLAWIDLSSGDFYTQKAGLDALSSIIARIGPREILIDQALQDGVDSPLLSLLKDERQTVTFHRQPQLDSEKGWYTSLKELGIDPGQAKFSYEEQAAGSLLLNYVEAQLQGSKARLQSPIQRSADEFMLIDKNSIKALEIKSTLADNLYEGSLLHTLRKTVTKSGTRLLSQRLSAPSTSLDEINSRLDMVTELIGNESLHECLVDLLRQSFDSFRLVQRFSFGRGDADDLISLSRTIAITVDIRRLMQGHHEGDSQQIDETAPRPFNNLINKLALEGPLDLAEKIQTCIDEDMLSEQHRIEDAEAADLVNLAEEVLSQAGEDSLKGVPRNIRAKLAQPEQSNAPTWAHWGDQAPWIMRKEASTTLSRLHKNLTSLYREMEDLETSLRETSGAKSLSLKWNPGKGYMCHVRGKDAKAKILESLNMTRQIASSQSTRTFYLTEWSQLGSRIDEARARIKAEEQRVFNSLREAVIRNLVALRRNATVLDELDVACAFATLAKQRHWTRPLLNNGTKHEIVGGRHPMVEAGLTMNGRNFTSNDCTVGTTRPLHPSTTVPPQVQHLSPEERILLITGPNMAGKSTYLRQNALISILAQTGSYVPADYASLGLVDSIFSRVGSADNLYLSQSTFMLEMLETAHILKHATPRSFVIMDEVGRGTTPEDGVAVSYAALWYLYHRNGCRALFATHFHKLADMVGEWEGVGCWCTDVVEDGDKKGWAYVHKVRRGVNRRSHALKVAKMAGLPDEAIDIAAKALEEMDVPSGSERTASEEIDDEERMYLIAARGGG